MVDQTIGINKGLEKAQQRYEQAKQKLAQEVAKAKEEKRRAETHHKCVMGGLVAKYLPECYQFEESELNNIIRAAVFSADCKKAVAKVKSGSAESSAGNVVAQVPDAGTGQTEQ